MLLEGTTTAFTLLQKVWVRAFVVICILAVVEIGKDYVEIDRPVFSLSTVGLVVAALSIFLVFRVNEAYARWWEARILWGQLVNASRGLARQATTLIVSNGDGDGSQRVEMIRRELVYRQIAFVNALRLSLRREDGLDELAPLLAPSEFEGLEAAANRPTQLLQCQGRAIAAARASGNLTEIGELMFDRTLNALHEVQGGCERIKNTAFPDKVAFATQVIAWSMAGLTAVAIAHPENGFDLIDTIVLPFMMLGFVVTERIGAELRNPFENAPNDTPMTALCRTIEIDLRQNLGEQDIPPPIEPVRGVLM